MNHTYLLVDCKCLDLIEMLSKLLMNSIADQLASIELIGRDLNLRRLQVFRVGSIGCRTWSATFARFLRIDSNF